MADTFVSGNIASTSVVGSYLASVRIHGPIVDFAFFGVPGEVEGSKKHGYRGRRIDLEFLIIAASENAAVEASVDILRDLAENPSTVTIFGQAFHGVVLESSSTSQPSQTGFGTYRAVLSCRVNALRLDGGDVDESAVRLLPTFAGVEYPKSEARVVRHSFGVNPGFALVDIPLKDAHESAPKVVCVNDSPWTQIKGFSLAKVTASGETLMLGQVASKSGSIGADTMSVEILDARWFLGRRQMIGSLWAYGPDLDSVGFKQALPADFNPNGEPNCIAANVGELGQVPAFCPPRYGIADGEDAAKDLDDSFGSDEQGKRACYWTPSLILRYCRLYFMAATLTPFDYFNSDWPGWILWPEDLHETIIDEVADTEERKTRSLSAAGRNLAQLLSDAMRMAGPYDLNISYSGDTCSIGWARTRSTGEGGETLQRPTGNIGSVLGSGDDILGGEYREDFKDTVTRVLVDGDTRKYEARVSEDNGQEEPEEGEEGEPQDIAATLVRAWSPTREAAALGTFINLINLHGEGAYPRAVAAARRAAPEVGALYRVAPSYDFTLSGALGGELDYTADYIVPTPRVVLPKLLSGFLEDADGEDYVAKMQHRLPIAVEVQHVVKQAGAEKEHWLGVHNGMPFRVDAIDDDGSIWLNSLADARLTMVFERSDEAPGWKITFRPVRMTLGIPSDTTVHAAHKLGVDPSMASPISSSDLEHDQGLMDAEGGANHAHYIMTQGLYRYEERIGALEGDEGPYDSSFPIPESAGGEAAEAKILADDHARASAHAKRALMEMGRVTKSGLLVMKRIIPAQWQVGMQINDFSNGFPIKAVVAAVEFHGGIAQETRLTLA